MHASLVSLSLYGVHRQSIRKYQYAQSTPINAITLHASYAILTLYAMSDSLRTDHELTFLTQKRGKGYKHIYHQHHATMKKKKKKDILLIPPLTEKQK